MTQRFAPWRRDYVRGALLLALAAAAAAVAAAAAFGLLARAGAPSSGGGPLGAAPAWGWLPDSASAWRWLPDLALSWRVLPGAQAWLAALAAAAAVVCTAAGLRRLRRGAVRRRGKRIERDAIGDLGALPWGWRAQPNHRLPGGGDVDLLVRAFWGRRYAVEIKSKGAVRVERAWFGLRRHLRDAEGRPLPRDPVGQAARNAQQLGAKPVLWLPQSDGPTERLTGGVLLVRGDAQRLRAALGIGRWSWLIGAVALLAAAAGAAAMALVLAFTVSGPARAQAFQPYPTFRITPEQWQAYHDEVRQRLGAAAQPLPDDRLVVYEDRAARTLWAFTAPDHPAHPAWVAKRVLRVGNAVGIQQVGYFAGDEVAFGRLFRSYDRAPASEAPGGMPQSTGSAPGNKAQPSGSAAGSAQRASDAPGGVAAPAGNAQTGKPPGSTAP